MTRFLGHLQTVHGLSELDVDQSINHLFVPYKKDEEEDPLHPIVEQEIKKIWMDDNVHENFFRFNKTYWFRLVQFFRRLQDYFVEHKLQRFRAIPQYKHGAKHVRFDTQGMCKMLSKLKLTANGTSLPFKYENVRRDTNLKSQMFNRFFNVKECETRHHKFDHGFTTDGLSVGIIMHRTNDKKTAT